MENHSLENIQDDHSPIVTLGNSYILMNVTQS